MGVFQLYPSKHYVTWGKQTYLWQCHYPSLMMANFLHAAWRWIYHSFKFKPLLCSCSILSQWFLCALFSMILWIIAQVFNIKINVLFPESSQIPSLKWAVFLKSSSICHFYKSGISKKRESQFSLKWNKEQSVSLLKINILIVYVVPAHGLQIGDKLHSPDYFPSCQGQMKPHSIKGMWFTQTLEGSQCWPVGSSSQLISVCFSLPFSTIRLFDWNFLKGRRRTQIW